MHNRKLLVAVGLALVISAIIPAAGSARADAARAVAAPRVTVVPANLVPGQLFGVAATSASDAWVVGTTSTVPDPNQGTALIRHWNGSVWTQLPSPVPASSSLAAVAATSSSNAWAVGTANGRTLILRWNGSVWTRVPSPAPGRSSSLSGVTAISPTNAWAVGSQTTASFAARMLTLHWNGRVWKRVPTPNLPQHFEGFLSGVSAASARNIWAVGSMTNCGCGPGIAVILHWNGRTWKRRHVSTRGGYSLRGVTAVSARRAWVVGTTGEGDSPTRAQTARFNGRVWKTVRTPSPGARGKLFDSLAAVAATSPRNAWTVGSTGDAILIERWNGSAWKRVPGTITFPPPDPGVRPAAHTDRLSGVAATSPGNAWAVGSVFVDRTQSYLSVILHWNGTAWT